MYCICIGNLSGSSQCWPVADASVQGHCTTASRHLLCEEWRRHMALDMAMAKMAQNGRLDALDGPTIVCPFLVYKIRQASMFGNLKMFEQYPQVPRGGMTFRTMRSSFDHIWPLHATAQRSLLEAWHNCRHTINHTWGYFSSYSQVFCNWTGKCGKIRRYIDIDTDTYRYCR